MQHRLAQIFRPDSGHTVMLAIDHGYFQGPTTGLERVDLDIVPLVPLADALMLTRGILRTVIPPTIQQGFVVRASGGPSILKELSNEQIAIDVDDAVRLGASAMAVQVFVGGEFETQSVHNLTRLVDEGYRRGIPVLGVTAVGKELVRDARYLGLATRICAELGAQVVKTYYCDEGFERVTAGCPVPIVMAGGKKLPELDALTMARRAIDAGAAGVDMGRNIFQSDAPIAMLQAVRTVVHDGASPAEAYDIFRALRSEFGPGRRTRSDDGTAPVAGRATRPSPAGGPRLTVGMLTADLLHLGDEMAVLERAGVELVHVDVMDGVFCPMLTVGPPIVRAIRSPMLKDVHLMIDDPLTKIDAFVAAGADMITFHIEGAPQPHRVLQVLGRRRT